MVEAITEHKPGMFLQNKDLLVLSIGLLVFGFSISGYGFYKTMKTENNSLITHTCERIVELKKQNAMPVKHYSGSPAKVDFSTMPEAAMFYTKITEATAEGANYAGHYAIATWGCGTSCQDHAIIDVTTGKIVAYGLPSEMGTSFDLDDRIFITNPASSLPRPDKLDSFKEEDLTLSFARIPREYYEIIEDDSTAYLLKICVESAAEGVYELKAK